jgi:hypothetical protein
MAPPCHAVQSEAPCRPVGLRRSQPHSSQRFMVKMRVIDRPSPARGARSPGTPSWWINGSTGTRRSPERVRASEIVRLTNSAASHAFPSNRAVLIALSSVARICTRTNPVPTVTATKSSTLMRRPSWRTCTPVLSKRIAERVQDRAVCSGRHHPASSGDGGWPSGEQAPMEAQRANRTGLRKAPFTRLCRALPGGMVPAMPRYPEQR